MISRDTTIIPLYFLIFISTLTKIYKILFTVKVFLLELSYVSTHSKIYPFIVFTCAMYIVIY